MAFAPTPFAQRRMSLERLQGGRSAPDWGGSGARRRVRSSAFAESPEAAAAIGALLGGGMERDVDRSP